MLTALQDFSVRQAFELCTIFSAVSCVLAAAKLLRVASVRQYSPFLGLLAVWFTFCVVSVTIPVSSVLYFRVYVVAAPISWVLYLLVARDVYQKIFSEFRGIATAGRWCLYISGVGLLADGFWGVWYAPSKMKAGALFAALSFVDQSVLFGLAFLLALVVAVIVRYPISIQRNRVVHTLVFSGILFSQSVCQLADRWTGHKETLFWNAIIAGLDTMLLFTWAALITKAGETIHVRIRHHVGPEMADHLLGQLNGLNGALLRAGRK